MTLNLMCLALGLALISGAVWAAGARDARTRQVARSNWGLAIYLIGVALILIGGLS